MSGASNRPKLVYLAQRHPALDPAGFVRRWRQHGALGMSMARWKNVWRYAHCDVLRGSGILGVSEDYDGVGIVWHRSPEARRAHREDCSAQDAMERDELETFAGLVGGFCALYDETVLLPPVKGARVKLMRFMRLAPEASIAAALALLDAEARAIGVDLRRRVRNVRSAPETTLWGLRYDLLEECWFDDAECAARAQTLRTADAAPLVADEVKLLTIEVVLYRLTEPS